MTTGTKIIESALTKIGAYSPLKPTNPESVVSVMDTLNSFIAELQDNGVDMGVVPLSAPGDELSEPLGARNAIVNNLAILAQPDFPGTVVSQDLRINAAKGMQKLLNQWKTVSIPKKQVRGTLPQGAGNKSHGYFGETFFAEGDEIG